MASDVLQDRYERIALDLTTFIFDTASNDGNPPTKNEILETYVQCYNTIRNGEVDYGKMTVKSN